MEEKIKKRLFIAIDLPDLIKKSIHESFLSVSDANLKPIAKDHMHITLRFIGYVDDAQISLIKEALQQSLKKIYSFYFKISDRISCFPNVEKAKVLFIRIEKGADSFLELFKTVEKELCNVSLKEESRPYIPHITLARTKNPCSIIDIVKKIGFDLNNEILCDKLTLFESVLNKNGPKYSIIAEYNLKNYE
jgi:RNA 2',3'-cyclic 3'-phosphodiesterase